jgi:formate hydrogenlyase subunit 3/multisubunit Na+/H+ antiporter MnhD subunit
MCFGFVILVSYHSQDKRLVSLNNLNPLLKRLYYFSRLCLIGLPFLRGFFSKDFIIEKIIEFNREFFLIFLLIVFLRVRVYYGMKLITLTNVFYSYTIIEKSYLGIFGVVVIILIITRIINLYVSLILSLRLEILSFKIVIYFFILIFLMIRVLININFKFNVYDKIKRFKEV